MGAVSLDTAPIMKEQMHTQSTTKLYKQFAFQAIVVARLNVC